MSKAILTKKSLVLKYQKGVDDSGSPNFLTQKFSKVKIDAEDTKLYEVGKALSELLESKVNSILKEDDFKFVEDTQ
ncbi:DUF1659 domain-containing protein [Clostridium sp.]|uniref:DUF1659 domain-containing protein n=1 Tax=Clostridium sp. TaxID=1506 RepID=UPI002616FD74